MRIRGGVRHDAVVEVANIFLERSLPTSVADNHNGDLKCDNGQTMPPMFLRCGIFARTEGRRLSMTSLQPGGDADVVRARASVVHAETVGAVSADG